MKKNYFLKVLALAVVAMISTFAISCSEEDLSINGGDVDFPEIPELAKPIASLAISVVDFNNGETLQYEIKDVSSSIGQTITIPCPTIEGYTTANNINVAVPAIEKGQAIVIPVTFYVANINTEFQKILDKFNGKLPIDPTVNSVIIDCKLDATGHLEMANNVITNTTGDVEKMTISLPYKSGYKYRGNETTISRSLSVDDFKDFDFNDATKTYELTIPNNSRVTFRATQEFIPVEFTLENGEIVKLWEAGVTTFEYEIELLSHGHDHGHGHGHGSGNAGGGIGGDNAGE